MCRTKGLVYAAMACFAIEFITLFMGVTIFMTGLVLLNIVTHGVGLILIILFLVDVSAGGRGEGEQCVAMSIKQGA